MHLGEPVTSRRRPPQREAAIMKKADELLPLACPHLKTEIKELVEAVTDGLQAVSPAPTHCDLSSSHIVLDGDRLALIDLDEFAGADPMVGVARFLVPLATAPLRLPLSRERALPAARAFVEEYFAHAPGAWRERLPLYYTVTVLKMTVGFYRRQEPGYVGKIEALVREARGYLSNDTWR
jgi:aminoglycoside phosphotransferase (APT) family kinase protein